MKIAKVREVDCVGCSKCLDPCPVDAIIGSPKFMHSILTEECIGCGLCVAPCPMDCIEMIESDIQEGSAEKLALAQKAKLRYAAKRERLIREAPLQLSLQISMNDPNYREQKEKVRTEIEAAVERVKNRRKFPGTVAKDEKDAQDAKDTKNAKDSPSESL